MKIGHLLGCHQRPERSFFLCGYQFPLCARCTGIIVGYMIFFIFPADRHFSVNVLLLLCAVMLFDWLIQHLGLRESTNVRRLITGTLGGYGLMGIYINILDSLVQVTLAIFKGVN